MESGNIAWMLMASALVLLMTPGLAFFYGGLVRGNSGKCPIQPFTHHPTLQKHSG